MTGPMYGLPVSGMRKVPHSIVRLVWVRLWSHPLFQTDFVEVPPKRFFHW